MNLHSLKNTKGQIRGLKRVGRGRASGSGKTGGRGSKGQMSRKGHKHKDGFEGGQMRLIRRIPKRGFKNPVRKEFFGVNVAELSVFAAGSEVTPALLKEKGIVRSSVSLIKILGNGELSAKLAVKAQAFSASAKAKIEALGGSCEVIKE